MIPASLSDRDPTPGFFHRLRSLRLRTYLVVMVVLLLPLGFVGLSHYQDMGTASRMLARTSLSAADTAASLGDDSTPDPQQLAVDVERIAREHKVWVRVLNPEGEIVASANHAEVFPNLGGNERIFIGPRRILKLEDFDAQLGPIAQRREVKDAVSRITSSDCRTGDDAQLVVCHTVLFIRSPGTETGWAIYSQDGSRRALRALYDFREQMFQLTLILLPLALLLAWWLGTRIMNPVQRLRRQVLDKVTEAAPRADLDLGRDDEFGELANAFNALLKALEERNASNEAFVADLAHEFKNPVAAIRAAAESLESGEISGAKAERLAGILNDSSRRLDALVTQFLELARAEAGMQRDAREAVDLEQLAHGVVDTLQRDERYHDVEFSVSGNGTTQVQGVSHGLESVVRNLVENAASFAAPEGRVDVTVESRGASVLLEVSDTGPGIAPDDLPRVFDRFFTTRGGQKGTGLGLALVRATVEAHGGTVRARSELGKGATFEVRIPRGGVVDRRA